MSVVLGTGDGIFRDNQDFQTGKNPISVALGDLNGDGKLDFAVANQDANTVSVVLNTSQ